MQIFGPNELLEDVQAGQEIQELLPGDRSGAGLLVKAQEAQTEASEQIARAEALLGEGRLESQNHQCQTGYQRSHGFPLFTYSSGWCLTESALMGVVSDRQTCNGVPLTARPGARQTGACNQWLPNDRMPADHGTHRARSG